MDLPNLDAAAVGLPPSAPRRPVHLRRIHCQGFHRDDGLIDIEGSLIDTQSRALDMPDKQVAAGDAVHHMWLRLTINRNRVVHDAQARTLVSPHHHCGEIAPAYRQLVGLRIEAGFNERVKLLFRGTAGCSHLTELLPVMATTAFQVLWSEPDGFAGPEEDTRAPRGSPLGRCHALRVDNPWVQVHFPHLLRGEAGGG